MPKKEKSRTFSLGFSSPTESKARFKSKKISGLLHKSIKRYWLGDSEFKTHLLNSFHLLFPLGENYFIRSMKPFRHAIKNEKLADELKVFLQQEAAHAKEHQNFITILKEQGYPTDFMEKVLKTLVDDFLSPLIGDKLNLSTTAGLEHFTSLLAQLALSENFLKEAEPSLRALFEWHALEEIEHRSVAFDVLNEIDDSYLLRIMGLGIGATTITTLSTSLVLFFLIHDRYKNVSSSTLAQILGESLDVLIVKEKLLFKAMTMVSHYLKPDFHPSFDLMQNSMDELLRNYDFTFYENGFANVV